MADEEQQGQPPAEGDESPAEETSPPAPEAQADKGVDEGEAPAEQPAPEEPAPEEPAPVEATAAPDEPPEAPADAAAEEPPAEATAEEAEEPRRQRPPRREADEKSEETVVPGAHLEPDLVLEERQAAAEGEFDPYATTDDGTPVAEGEETATVEEAPGAAAAPRTPLDLAADARYRATGKRKRAVARVILKPGEGAYTINGKELDTYFPRATLQKHARQPLETTGNGSRMDVVAKIHGGGVSAQAIALRHG